MYEYHRNSDFNRCQAISRLLVVELALRAFQIDHGELPDDLDHLRPAYISAIPLDPFDPGGGRLKYLRTNDGHILYSFGPDKFDDGGQPLTQDISYAEHGDLRLDKYYASDDDSTPNDVEGNDDEASSGPDAKAVDATKTE
jgi:hypothetical protein